MLESLLVVLRLLAEMAGLALRPVLELAGAMTAPGAGTVAIAAASAATAALVALALLAVAISLFARPAFAVAANTAPHRAIDDATRLTETHPDAPGHSRPRAPGSAAPAA